ncbi:hypothetical protein APA22_26910 [Acetobacter pasteurianus IFO 3283-22]|uniref:Uncharacterized protein n=1 Tax=Acetobacter pasteurianus (strain NBRC 105184 / IFO 3283-01) TaxID=634452 RepID=C7JH48_ACEP3|nr:hypothetical protein DB34_03965 [Acetobacter pasteurianus]BAI00783.1 hypothetical protein APA01_26910 [Acetobacter pasteurianus IFO 3283-01]BAI03832.1 hypothetical protein APA03_26910 [Acetobacter pasteurianus IFO 3283-03]BAI06879.1 hypothetical protein APA07_26910 [Acetobacter pasteurianus IFO 3283-07]BAI09927.1 hypothetical protein APA22_26910 [Acetobacter pasteurianus IFO 3283-22]BAI12975.1 hypothetical protein APA26_26910 [Acetobacter pasteurianus IFO 3283-26]BAI16021.1 hypothetical pr
MKNTAHRRKIGSVNLLVAIVLHNKNSTTNSQDRPMLSMRHSIKSQNPLKNKGFAPGTFLGYRFITIAKVRLNASCCFQIDTLARFLVHSTHNQLTASCVTRENRTAPFLYSEASGWFCVDNFSKNAVTFSSRHSCVQRNPHHAGCAFFVLSQIVINMQVSDGRKISRASVRLHA